MRNRIKLFNYPFLNAGVTFKADELNLRAEKFITEVKVLIPRIHHLSCDLDCEMLLHNDHMSLVIFLFQQPQFALPMFPKIQLNEAKLEIIDDLKKLPLKLNLLALETFSVGNLADYTKDVDEEKMRELLKKKKNETIKFLLEDEDISFGFPEMAPFVIDPAIRLIQFNIEYIHSDHFKIKLLSDSLDEFNRKKTTFLKVRNKIFDDTFFFDCADALRSKPKKLLSLEAYCIRDSITNDILMYQVI